MNKKLLIFLSLLATTTLHANECYQVGKSKSIPNFSSMIFSNEETFINDNVILYPASTQGMGGFGVSDSQDQEVFKYYDRKNGKLVTEKKKASEFPSLLKNGNIALYDLNLNFAELYENNEDGSWKLKDENKYLEAIKKTKTTEIDPQTGKKTVHQGKIYSSSGTLFTPEKIETIGSAKYIVGKDLRGKELKMILQPSNNSIGYDQESDRDFIINNDKFEITEGGKKIYSNSLDKNYTIGYSNYSAGGAAATPNRKFHYYNVFEKQNVSMMGMSVASYTAYDTTKDSNYLIYNSDKKTHQLTKIPAGYFISSKNNSTTKDENKVLLASLNPSLGLKYLDLESGQTKTITDANITNARFFGDNKVCGTKYEIAQLPNTSNNSGNMFIYNNYNNFDPSKSKIVFECYDLDGKKLSSKLITKNINATVSALSEDEFIVTESNLRGVFNAGLGYGMGIGFGSNVLPDSQIIYPREYCPKSIQFEDCHCDLSTTSSNELNSLLGIESRLLCQSDYNLQDWSKVIPNDPNKIDEKTAILWLKKISKPNSFIESDLDVLKTLIENGIHKKYSGEFKAAMVSIMATNASLYDQIVNKYPSILELDNSKIKEDCTTNSEKEFIAKKVQEYIKKKLSTIEQLSDEELKPLISLGKNYLNHDQQDKLAEDLGDLAVEKMQLDPKLANVFSSKVFKFAYNHYKKELGIDHKDLSDITVVRKQDGTLEVLQLGVSPFEGSKRALGGIQLKSIKTIDDKTIPAHQVENLSWNYGGKEFSAKIDLSRDTTSKDITPANISPDYKAMKSKEPFKGLIIAGSNLGQPLTQNLVQEYLEYYAEQGFDFEEAQEINDIPKYFESRIYGPDKAHYLVKEAHSDGDEKNLFRMSQKGKLLKGIKNNDDGTKELIEIVYPGSDPATTLLSNAQFGNWMKEREKENGPELVYLNSSCWSHSKATYEIAAAKTPKLINIPTTTSMTTFTNVSLNPMYAAIHGLRNEKTYEEIRNDMKADKGYAAKSSNVMIFPDEPAYDSKIRNFVKVPISIDTKITVKKDGKEVPYSIEE